MEGIALAELLAFSHGEKSARERHGTAQLLDERAFSGSRAAGHKHLPRPAIGDPLEGCGEAIEFRGASMEAARRAGPRGNVLGRQRDFLQRAAFGERLMKEREIPRQRGRALRSLFGFLREKLEKDSLEDFRNPGRGDSRRIREPRHVGMEDFCRRLLREGRLAGGERVKHGTERVEVRPPIHGAVHQAGLLGRDPEGIAREAGRSPLGRWLLHEGRRRAESDQLHGQLARPHENVGGFNGTVDDPPRVNRSHGTGEVFCEEEESRQIPGAHQVRRVETHPAEVGHRETSGRLLRVDQAGAALRPLKPLENAALVFQALRSSQADSRGGFENPGRAVGSREALDAVGSAVVQKLPATLMREWRGHRSVWSSPAGLIVKRGHLDEVAAVAAKFGGDIAAVGLDGQIRAPELGSDFLGSHSRSDQVEHLEFPLAQKGLGIQNGLDGRVQASCVLVDFHDLPQQGIHAHGFVQDRVDGLAKILRALERRGVCAHHDRSRVRIQAGEGPRHLETVAIGQDEVEQEKVRPGGFAEFDPLGHRVCNSHHFKSPARFEQGTQHLLEHHLILHDHTAHFPAGNPGICLWEGF